MQKSLYKENVLHPSLTLRRHIAQQYGSRSGRLSGSHFTLTLTTGLSFTIAPGRLVAMSSLSSAGDAYYFDSNLIETRSCTPANSSNPRNDLVVAKITDNFLGGTTNVDDIVVLAGTAASTPQDPAIPTDGTYVALYRVRVSAGAQTLLTSNITDIRPSVIGLAGTPQPVSTLAEQSALGQLRAGSSVWREDLKHPLWIDAAGIWYDPLNDLSVHQANSDTIFNGQLATHTSQIGYGGLQFGVDYKSAPGQWSGINIVNATLFSSSGSIFTLTAGGAAVQIWINSETTPKLTDQGTCQAALRTWDSSGNGSWGAWKRLSWQASFNRYAAPISGTVQTTNTDGSTTGTVNVTWPPNRFSTVPVVDVQLNSAAGAALQATHLVYNLTTTGCTIQSRFPYGLTGSYTLMVKADTAG